MIGSKSCINEIRYKIKYPQDNFENAEVLEFLFEILLCFIASRTHNGAETVVIIRIINP